MQPDVNLNAISNILFGRVEELLSLNSNSTKALHRLGIHNIRDLLFYLPGSHQIKNLSPDLSNLKTGEIIQSEVIIQDITLGKGKSPTKILAGNSTGRILLVFFNKIPPFIFQKLRIDSKHIICGKVQFFEHFYQINHPEFILRKELEVQFEPVYSLTYGLTNKQLYYYICRAFEACDNSHPDAGSTFINDLKTLHLYNFKQDASRIPYLWQKSRKNLARLELIANQASLKLMRKQRGLQKGHQFIVAHTLRQLILSNLNFELTQGQKEVLEEIEKDQLRPLQMMRLLQGDVGSGKTLVALLSIINVVCSANLRNRHPQACSGSKSAIHEIRKPSQDDARIYQAVLMAPTDLLANQHYQFFKQSLEATGVTIALLTGKTSQKERKALVENLETGEIQILIGTHALFQEKISFKNLAYIVIDEQHKFGVEQRLRLINKALHPDVLVMTATPIPRSLTLTMFGDMEVSNLRTKPKNRLPIITSIISGTKIYDVIQALARKISQGEKVYWVCPLIENVEDGNDNALKDAISRFEALETRYKGNVGLLHGKMRQEEKENIMERFKAGDIKILVATTVVEVGVDVTDATLMVIENAEQFGLAQMHQLRGRVGRGNLQSHCILIYNARRTSAIAKNRLEIMKTSDDGFYIAEQDMLLRGSGEILGAKQSGDPEFFFANLKEDLPLLIEANHLANELEITNLTELQIKIFAKKDIDLAILHQNNN
jgi:ATP-dependent DNA helicase RecG